MSMPDLTTIRTQIDDLDKQIQELITQRAVLAKQVAQAKFAAEANPLIYRPERETAILRQVIERNQPHQGWLPDEALVRIFREIMSTCLVLQKPVSVGYLGPEGTFSQAAVVKHFGQGISAVSLATIEQVFRETEAGNVQYGVVPIINSTEGGVSQTLDCFLETKLKICGEVELPIHHYLLSQVKALSEIECLYYHPQALAQCRVWIDSYLPKVARVAVNSNAEAARRASVEGGTAAIAGHHAAEIYGLGVLAARIESDSNNTTRFVVLGQQAVPRTGKDRTSLLLHTQRDRPGALCALLEVFAENGLNMTRLESRPSRYQKWEYFFFADIEGHIADEAVARAMGDLERKAAFAKHLGSYPCAVLEG